MATHGDIGLSQPAASTITFKVRTVSLDLNSTIVHQEVLTLGGAESSLEVARVVASPPNSTHYGLVTRPAVPVLTTFSASTVTSSATTVVSSHASLAARVAAFTVSSTIAGPLACGFYSSATLLWPVTLWAAGGKITETVAVAAPGYLFGNSAANALTFNVPSTGSYQIAVSYWSQ